MTFGQCLWTILKVAGIVLGCITFFKMVAAVGIMGVIKTIPSAIMDLTEMGWNWLTGATIEIFPRIQLLWSDAYNSVITLITGGNRTGQVPYFTYVMENGVMGRHLRWYPLKGLPEGFFECTS
jgi:hypothetical protein